MTAAHSAPWFIRELDRKRRADRVTYEQLAAAVTLERTTQNRPLKGPISVRTLKRILGCGGKVTFLDFRVVEAIGYALGLELDFFSAATGKRRRR